ncbi:MAG: IS1634 family transposase, partial [Bacteroidales bacterium]|nr:IS1634 family transposase [Bacteroidales bacterium]
MATIQSKTTKGYKYWYIVESRRVNGKPRPIVLAYLGKAEDLLKRLQGNLSFKLKSYSHGGVS